MEKIPSEHFEQRQFVQWFRQNLPGVIIFAIPNGGKRNPTEALKLKAEGVLSGVSDLFIPKFFLFIEMKKIKKAYPTKQQKQFISDMEALGYKGVVAYGCNDAVNYIKKNYSNYLAKK